MTLFPLAHGTTLEYRKKGRRAASGKEISNEEGSKRLALVSFGEYWQFPDEAKRPLARTPPEQHNLDALKHDQEIKAERSVLNIEEIVLQFFFGVLERVSVFVANLRPSSHARPNDMPHVV